LLQGSLDREVLTILTSPEKGLFPEPAELQMSCTCADFAHLCPHLSAVLYAVGVRFDEQSDLFFHLRGVDHRELLNSAVSQAADLTSPEPSQSSNPSQDILKGIDLSDLFGISISEPESAFPQGKEST
ncbi:MAG: hypothetical protein AAF191_11815, partial [Verrucomicrobiota bacterium]